MGNGWPWYWKAATALGAYSAATYMVDVPIRRAVAARAAREHADLRGLPLLNVGAGTGGTALFGETLYGDVNVDLGGRRDVPHGTPGVVTYANAEDLPFEDGSMGAVLASHLLEHVHDPEKAINEWLRVAGGDRASLFVVTPSWWAPHTWVHPGHYWYFPDANGGLRDNRITQLKAVPGDGSDLALAGFHRILGLKPVAVGTAAEAARIAERRRLEARRTEAARSAARRAVLLPART